MALDFMYSLAYYDYDKLSTDLKIRSGTTMTNAQGSKLDSVCQLRKNLHYYNADGSENLEGDSSKKSRWLFFHSDFFDKKSGERLWLAHFNYQKPKKTWTYVGMCTVDDLVLLCTPIQDASTCENLERIAEELKTLNKSFGDDFSEIYQGMTKNRVKSVSKKLEKGSSVKELKKKPRGLFDDYDDEPTETEEPIKVVEETETAEKAKTKEKVLVGAVVSSDSDSVTVTEPETVSEAETSSNDVEPAVVENEPTVIEQSLSPVNVATEETAVAVPDKVKTHAELVDSLAFVEITAIPIKFIEELASYIDKSCVFVNVKALSVYFKSLVTRLSSLLHKRTTSEMTEDRYCLFGRNSTNSKTSFVLFNSGLPSIFGEDIYILADYSMSASVSGKVFNFMILTSKALLKDRNFTVPSELNLKRVPFFNSPSDLIFDSEMANIDFEDKSRFIHCLEERNERVSEEMQNMPFAQCCRDMKAAVMDAIKLNSLDYSYIKPFYSYSSNEIGFMLPYWINQDKSKKPTLAIVLAKLEGFWKIATILPMEMAYASVLLLSPYTRDWDEYIK